MAKRKKKTALPRLTVLAMSRAELVSFVSAVEQLRLLVNDMGAILPQLRELMAARKRSAAKPPPALGTAHEGGEGEQ